MVKKVLNVLIGGDSCAFEVLCVSMTLRGAIVNDGLHTGWAISRSFEGKLARLGTFSVGQR